MKENIVRKTLNNGLRFIYVRNNKKNVVINIGVKVGLLNENFENNGVSHFLEHVLWEGTITNTGKEIRNAVKKMHGEYNACTGLNSTNYYIEVPRRHFVKALELIAGVITKPVFNEEEINKERNVILNELTLYSDHPFASVDKIAKRELFSDNILSKPIGGDEDNIKKINKTILEEHYKKYYVSNNMVVTVIGDIDDPISNIEENFKLERDVVPEVSHFEPKIVLPKEFVEQSSTKASYVELAFLTTSYNNEESYALSVIEALLDEGKNLSLMEEVRYTYGLTYHVHIYSHALEETGIFAVGLSTEKNKTNEAIRLIKNQIHKIQKVNKTEVEKAKKIVINSFKEIKKDQIIYSRILTDCELANDWEYYNQLTPKIKAVTPEKIKEAATKYLQNNYVQVTLEQKDSN